MRYTHSPRVSGLRSNKHHLRKLRIIICTCIGNLEESSYTSTKAGKSLPALFKLTAILHAGQFPDIKIILKRWKEEGILKSEKDRYISDIQIVKEMPKVKGYMINMPEQKGHQ